MKTIKKISALLLGVMAMMTMASCERIDAGRRYQGKPLWRR